MAAFYSLFIAAFILDIPLTTTQGHTEDNSRYKTLQANSTLLKLLLEPNRDETMRSEIFDMLHSRDAELSAAGPAFPDAAPPPPDQPPSMQAELVQGFAEKVHKDAIRDWTQPTGRGGQMLRGAIPGIMIGVTCAIVLLAYLALVAYKRHEIMKNGTKHELLRNEDLTNETRIEL